MPAKIGRSAIPITESSSSMPRGNSGKVSAFHPAGPVWSLDFFPCPLGHRVPAFVKFDVVDEGFDRFAGETAFLNALRKREWGRV
jgi:hypothetical protein